MSTQDPSIYKTGNSVPSNAAQDVNDNAEVFDVFSNSQIPFVKSRLGADIKTIWQHGQDFDQNVENWNNTFEAQFTYKYIKSFEDANNAGEKITDATRLNAYSVGTEPNLVWYGLIQSTTIPSGGLDIPAEPNDNWVKLDYVNKTYLENQLLIDTGDVRHLGLAGDYPANTVDCAPILSAAVAGGAKTLKLGDNKNYFFGSNNPIEIVDSLIIYSETKAYIHVDSLDGKGCLQVLKGTNSKLTLINVEFVGVKQVVAETNDATDTYPVNLMDLENCEIDFRNISTNQLFSYHNLAFPFKFALICLNGCSGKVNDIEFKESGNEVFFNWNSTNLHIDNIRGSNTYAATNSRLAMYTLIHQQPRNAQNDRTQAVNNSVTNLYSSGHIGSGAKIGGINCKAINHVYEDCRKGLILDSESMPDPSSATGKYDLVEIENITVNGNAASGGLGFMVSEDTEINRATIKSLRIDNILGASYLINHIDDLTEENITVTNFDGIGYRADDILMCNQNDVTITPVASPTLTTGSNIMFKYSGASRRGYSKLRQRNVTCNRVNDVDLDAQEDVWITLLNDLDADDVEYNIANKNVLFDYINGKRKLRFTNSTINTTTSPTCLFMRFTDCDLDMRGTRFEGYSDAAFKTMSNNGVRFGIVNLNGIICKDGKDTAFTASHIVLNALDLAALYCTDSYMSDTSSAYGALFTISTGFSAMIGNNVTNTTLLYQASGGVVGTQVSSPSNPNKNNSWRTPLIFGSVWMWGDSSGNIRIKTSTPTSDTDGSILSTS
jgi:hypothetical protein